METGDSPNHPIPTTKQDANTIEFKVEVPAKGDVEVTYTSLYNY
ncbi:hypothetical protein C7960_1225 [Methanohalophilus euhalobius]|uniref:Uncharacterized protein n=1 Tax=Methanohalophilus euhalobius TaxID=51203 RepID=A0A285G591_9EURY|nr:MULTISPECIES: hypothetical protein [Methanohalophilus]ODV49707.1 MAG: hypothetical protein A8273_975 [Methanohalophilus sp. 2-GBenrich]RSD36474.1 MAG: hypothetical protein CI952_100 [Methanohalophilus sp.]TCL12015.1 hypothetical protein C7960_1225 [Methanohalophilus euhalobius]SNY18274.1 hypothetical protein SAMN06295989_10823 [Methanohalophilus euhalobius]